MEFEDDQKSYSSGAPEHQGGLLNGFTGRAVDREGGEALVLHSSLIDGFAKSHSSHDHTSHEEIASSRTKNALDMNGKDVSIHYYESLENFHSLDRNSISLHQHQTTHASRVDFFKPLAQEIFADIVERPWDDFTNKNIEENCEFGIEVLVGDAYIPELGNKKVLKEADKKLQGKMIPGIKTAARTELAKTPLKTARETRQPVPEQIRINSTEILYELSAIDKSFDASMPLVMRRPYKFLVYHTDRIDHIIKSLQSRVSYLEQSGQETNEAQKSLQHMLLIPKFLEKYVSPTLSRLSLDTTSKIEFSDLWYIFRPGEMVFMPLRVAQKYVDPEDMGTTPGVFQTRYEMLWRVTASGGGRTNISTPHRKTASRPNPFSVNCYYIDYDGKSFCPIIHTFTIAPFEGERNITELELFPVRFLKDGAEKARQHGLQGKATYESMAQSYSHSYYIGPTILVHPCGCPLPRDENLHQEYVESEVIIDFKTAYLNNPSWRPRPNYWKPPVIHEEETRSRWPVQCWEDPSRGKLHSAQPDQVYDDHFIDIESAIDFRDSQIIFNPVPTGWVATGVEIPNEELVILTARAFAFILRTRTWAGISFWTLQPIKPQKESLNNLRLRDESVKTTIQALVNSHFTSSASNNSFEYDVVRGKGKGLIILLHGAPGVGKTSTAESVAAAGGRPLFRITCGDLGLTPVEVERALKEIFRYAQLWNGVLLLDECDVFLAQRKKNDIKRNALVSIFLRTLEFYTGVLILATNRVGVLDEAVKSRLTWTAYYPPLSKIQTKEIWDVNIRLLKQKNDSVDIDEDGIRRFAKRHFKSNEGKNCAWNGRQIQNAFKVAAVLAEWENIDGIQAERLLSGQRPTESSSDHQTKPIVTAAHFEVIAKGTKAFDDYLLETQGRSEAERAWDEMERADDYSPDESDHSMRELSPLDRRSTRSPRLSFQAMPHRSSTAGLSTSVDQQQHLPQNGQMGMNSHNQDYVKGRRRSSVKNFRPPSQLDLADPNMGNSAPVQRQRRQSTRNLMQPPSPNISAPVPQLPRPLTNGHAQRRGSRHEPPNIFHDLLPLSNGDGHNNYFASSPSFDDLSNDPINGNESSDSGW